MQQSSEYEKLYLYDKIIVKIRLIHGNDSNLKSSKVIFDKVSVLILKK